MIKKAYFYLGIVMILILVNACSLLSGVGRRVPAGGKVTPTPGPAENIFASGMFTLELPAGWDVFGPLTVGGDANRPYELYRLGQNPTTDDGPGPSRIVIADPALWTPEEFVLAQCSTCPQHPFEQVELGGKEALRTQVGGGGVPFMVSWYFVEHRDKLVAFAIHDPQTLQPLEDVIGSIRFE